MQNLTLTITQLNTYIKQIIDAEDLISNVSVYGELSNYKVSNGNAYFDLKEEGSQISCIKFGEVVGLFKNGDRVLVTGKLNYHIKLGRLSFVVNKIEAYGMGDLYKKYLELKEKLASEGIFDERYKKQIPRYPKKIGVITSETGAVIRDILHVRQKKNPNTSVYIFPSKVQGIGAEDDVVRGIKFFENEFHVDVIIVARGGGSFEDLAPFNTEVVARAAFECKTPIISAVGHETDFSLLDFASDFRAPTPSVAGEVVFFDYESEVKKILNCIESVKYFMDKKISAIKSSTELHVQWLTSSIEGLYLKKLSELKVLDNELQNLIDKIFINKKNKLENLLTSIQENNPLNILSKGYSRLSKDNKTVSSVNQVETGDELIISLKDGEVTAKVLNVKEKK